MHILATNRSVDGTLGSNDQTTFDANLPLDGTVKTKVTFAGQIAFQDSAFGHRIHDNAGCTA
jgi:hypothetical protein